VIDDDNSERPSLPATTSRPAADDYHAALSAARMGAWETNLATRTRKWSPEAMKLFGFDLPEGLGVVGGDADEYVAALHPDDRHLMRHFHQTAHVQDFYEGDYRVVRPDGSVRWVTGRALVVEREDDGRARRTVTVVTDITEQKQAEEHVRFLLGELSHRSKNLITVIHSVAQRTVRTSASLQEFEQRFSRRLQALAASHDALINNDWKAAPLDVLIKGQLAFFTEGDAARIDVRGPNILINANSAQMIGLAVHELATNAVKHGALAVPGGRVSITWNLAAVADDALSINWQESQGPHVRTPSRIGFGHTVIRDMFMRALKSEVALEFPPSGLTWRADIPLSSLSTESATVDQN